MPIKKILGLLSLCLFLVNYSYGAENKYSDGVLTIPSLSVPTLGNYALTLELGDQGWFYIKSLEPFRSRGGSTATISLVNYKMNVPRVLAFGNYYNTQFQYYPDLNRLSLLDAVLDDTSPDTTPPTATDPDTTLIDDSLAGSVATAGTADFDSHTSAAFTLKAPAIAENGAVVPLTLEFNSFDPGPGAFWLLVPDNPETVAARFRIEPSVVPYVATRIKMDRTGDVIGIYIADDGSIYTVKQNIKVTIGGFGG